jgi:two-component system cell cycle sensor histidine kinase/response regulator CckA
MQAQRTPRAERLGQGERLGQSSGEAERADQHRIGSDARQGTTLRVPLPRAKQAGEQTPACPPLPRPPPQQGTVLVVDDDDDVRRVSQDMLEHAGFQVLTAESGQEAVLALRERRDSIDVVLLDLTMPQMDGETTFHALRRIRPDLPVVFMSGHGKPRVALRLSERTRVDFLGKPFSPEGLREKIVAAF